MEENEVSYPIYSPASVIGIFSNALKLNATVNLIYLKADMLLVAVNPTETIIMTFCFQKVTTLL